METIHYTSKYPTGQKNEITVEIRKYFNFNDNQNMTYILTIVTVINFKENDISKFVGYSKKRKFIALITYIFKKKVLT